MLCTKLEDNKRMTMKKKFVVVRTQKLTTDKIECDFTTTNMFIFPKENILLSIPDTIYFS